MGSCVDVQWHIQKVSLAEEGTPGSALGHSTFDDHHQCKLDEIAKSTVAVKTWCSPPHSLVPLVACCDLALHTHV